LLDRKGAEHLHQSAQVILIGVAGHDGRKAVDAGICKQFRCLSLVAPSVDHHDVFRSCDHP
jgi:uncharacterized ferredoxin-like protein